MKLYVVSLGAGLIVGIVYSLLNVRSPALPVIALVGLFGILVGEQILPLARSIWSKEPAAVTWLDHVKPHMFGHLPFAGSRLETARGTMDIGDHS